MKRFGTLKRIAGLFCLLFLAGLSWRQQGMLARAGQGADSQVSQPVYNNGGYIVKAGETVYWSRPPIQYATKRCEGDIVYSSDGKKWELLWKTGYTDTKLYSDGFYLYFGSWEEQHGDMVYCMDLCSREVRPLCNGEIQYYDKAANKLYLRMSLSEYEAYEELDGLYSYDIASGNMLKILDREELPVLFEENCIYYTAQEGCELWKADTDSGAKELIIREESGGSSYEKERIRQLVKAGGRLVYSFGSYQGSAAVFYGNYYSIREDGGDKRVYPAERADLLVVGDYLCVNKGNWISATVERPGYYCLLPDFSREIYLEEAGEGDGAVISYDREGDWVYYEGRPEVKTIAETANSTGTENRMQGPDLYRMHSDGSGKELLISGEDVAFGLEEESDRCGYRRIQAVDGKLYAEMESWGYRGYSGWRDDFLERRVYSTELPEEKLSGQAAAMGEEAGENEGEVSLVQSVPMDPEWEPLSGGAVRQAGKAVSIRLRAWIDRNFNFFISRRKIFRCLKDAENPDLWPGKLTAAVYGDDGLKICQYDKKEDFLARYGFLGEEPYFTWYGEDGSLQTEFYYKEETGEGCGIRYVKEKGAEGAEGRLARGFVFEHTGKDAWTKRDPYSVRTADGRDGSESVEQFREYFAWTPEGKMLSYHSIGVLPYYGTEPRNVIDAAFRYREDKSLESRECWQSAEVFGSSGREIGYCRYGPGEELLYESVWHSRGSYEKYYIYREGGTEPAFCLSLDNRMGYWIAEGATLAPGNG